MPEDEKALAQAISIAQTLLRDQKDNITPELISEKVKLAGMVVTQPFDHGAAVAELIRRFSHWIGKDAGLTDSVGHVPWLDAARKVDWRYWPRYQSYLEQSLSDTVVEGLDDSTDGILELLEDPTRDGPWDRRGLVVGHVQSGKTANYSGLICKAADSGYKLIIVLAGMHNNLRSQTQIRLEETFLGYETSENSDHGKPVGVAEFDSDPSIHPHCATSRGEKGDFNSAVKKNLAISIETRPWLFVVKKHKKVLTSLLKWIRSHVADTTDAATKRRIVSQLPLLIIDDEADNASVDTGEQAFNDDGSPDEDHQPKAINGLIREILHAFSKSAYVGYTATPFANIFIHRKGETKKEGPDLFPKSFIRNLAAPTNYVGPARMFGRETTDGRVGELPLTRDIEDHFDEEAKEGWMPPKHKKDHEPTYEGQDTVPPSLREALHSFVLACAARECRGQGKKHSSMLVHVTRFVGVQKVVFRQVETVMKRMRQRITRGNGDSELIEALRLLWESDFVPTCKEVAELAPEPDGKSPAIPTWAEIEAKLPLVLSDIVVREVNGSAKDTLSYVEKEGVGLKVVAIGGDKLARGLTLEGLCTSYFVRTTKMYDTLMQMGRWFGYRPGYMDLCRLYTTSDLVEWFQHIADASEELREEFELMVETGATPEVYGMRVKSHPVLTITSPLKMQHSQTLSLSYSGSLAQTIVLPRDKATLERNLEATDRLLASMEGGAKPDSWARAGKEEKWDRSRIWRDVSSEKVVEFLASYQTHARATKANSSVLAEFVREMNLVGQLDKWTVAMVAEGPKAKPYKFPSGLELQAFPTRGDKSKADGKADSYTIGVLTDPADEAIDIPDAPWREALAATVALRKKLDPNASEPERPSGRELRALRARSAAELNRGLLLLYPLARPATVDPDPATNAPVIAFAISFPSSEAGVKVEYKVDLLLWEQEYASAD